MAPQTEAKGLVQVAIMGTGYVGLVTGACLADLGLSVTCVDTEHNKIAMLNQGRVPVFEPGLEELVRRNSQNGRLTFSPDIHQAIKDSLAVFLAVGTDAGENGRPNLSQVWAATDLIAESIEEYKVVVVKSTVPVGTAAKLAARIRQRLACPMEFDVVSNPEFLREGSAVEDFFHPNRIVIGSRSDRAALILKEIYRPLYLIETPFVFTTCESAELVKYAANAFLALKVSFINEIANLCDAVGPVLDIHVIAHALGLDRRIGPKFLHPGPGFGGYCFPKDTLALVSIARSHGEELRTIEAAITVNDRQYLRVVEKLRRGLGTLAGKTIAGLGLSFKPNTDDIRESRAIMIYKRLIEQKCTLRLFDPAAMAATSRVLEGPGITYCAGAYEAAGQSDAVVVTTEWNEFRSLDLRLLKETMRGNVLVDAKNIFDPGIARGLGFRYYGTGRGCEMPSASNDS